MVSKVKLAASAAFASFLLLAAPAVQAATVSFDFDSAVADPFTLKADSPGIVSGNCATAGGHCLGVNKKDAAVLSIESSQTFSVSSLWAQLLGKGTNLVITTSKGALTLLERDFTHNNKGQSFDFSSNSLFQDITSISFLTGKGNARVDDLTVNYTAPAPVPLPAAGVLLLGALGGLVALRRKKNTA